MASTQQASNVLSLIINAKADVATAVKEFNRLTKEIQKTAKAQRVLIGVTDKLTQSYAKLNSTAKKANLTMEQTAEGASKRMKSLQGAIMGVGFTALFGGMALKNFFQGVFNAMLNTFLLARGEQSEQAAQVNRLQGAWEYLKFSIMNALDQSGLFNSMIEGMIAVMNYLADLPNWVKTGFGAFTVGAIIVGGLLMVIGQVFLGIVGIMSLFELIGVAGMASIKGAVKGLIDELIILTTTTNGLLALSIVGGIILAIMWIWKLKEEMGGWGEFFKSVARGILNVWVVVMSAIGTAVQIALTPVLMMLQTIIDAYNWIAKKAGLSTFDMKVYNPNASIKDLWGDNVGRMSTLVSPIYDFLAPTQVKKEDMASQIMATRDEIMKTQGGVMSNTTSTNTSTVNNFNFDTVQVGDPDKFVTELLDKANTAQNKIYGSTSN